MSKLFLFTGENHQALSEKLKFWESEFVKKYDSTNLEKFEEVKQENLAQIINAIESQPFLADKRLIIIKDFPLPADSKKKLETEALEECLVEVPETSLVVFVSPKPDKRTRFYKFLSKNATTENFEVPKGLALKNWVQSRLASVKKRIDPQALDLFLLYCAEDVTRIAGEIEKISLLEIDQITVKDIEKFVSPTPEAKIFKSLDLIGKAPIEQLLLSFQKLVRTGESLMLIFFMIVRQFRLLIQVRSLLDKNVGRASVQKRLKLAPFQVGMLCKQAEYLSLEQLSEAYGKLAEIDFQIKTGGIPITSNSEELLHLKVDQFLCSLYE